MNSSRRERPQSPLSDYYYSDDGVDPRTYFNDKKRKTSHVAGRLMRTAIQAAEMIFSFALEDPELAGLEVVEAEMSREGTAVEISISPLPDTTKEEMQSIKEKLPQVARLVRAEVAQTLQRRKALGVSFRLLPPEGGHHE